MRILFAVLATLSVAARAAVVGLVASAAAAGAAEHAVDRSARSELALTVYSAGADLAMVREVRTVTLDTGDTTLRFDDLPTRLDPHTVALRSRTSPEQLTVREQSWRFDLPNPQTLLARWIGHDVELVQTDQKLRSKVTPATLLSTENGNVFQVGDRIVLDYRGELRLPPLAEPVYPRPALIWRLANGGPPEQQLELSYATAGLSWTAEYVAVLDAGGKSADFTAWIAMANQSGSRYQDATIALIAGDVRRMKVPERPMLGMTMRAMKAEAAPEPTEASFTEYHRYALEGRTTLAENETKQVPLFSARGVPVTKRYYVIGAPTFYRAAQRDLGEDLPVNVVMAFDNKAASHLGRPLPAGMVRWYAPDPAGAPQFMGEDRIQHTAVDEMVETEVGDAFDVTATRVQTDFKKLDVEPFQFESAFEVTLRNRRTEAVTVTVREPIQAEWKVVDSSVPPKKVDVRTLAFDVPVPAGGETVLRYRVQVGRPDPRPLP